MECKSCDAESLIEVFVNKLHKQQCKLVRDMQLSMHFY